MDVTYRIPLANSGLYATVSQEDYETVMSYMWHPMPQQHTTYAARSVYKGDGSRTTLLLHRFIMRTSRRFLVDHKDRDGLNCTRENLQVVGYSTSGHRRTTKRGITGWKGVFQSRDRYFARIGYLGQRIHLGMHETAIDAAIAYDMKALELYGNNAETNFVYV